MLELLLTGAFNYSKDEIKKIENLGYNVTFIQNELVKLDLDVSKIDYVICNGLFLHNDINEFKSLRGIQLTSAGFDRVPKEEIYAKGIQLFNAKDVYSIPMAEWVLLKILEIYKKSKVMYKNQIEKKWYKQRNVLELNGKTATIVGFGSVGLEVAKRLNVFGVNIIGVGRNHIESEYINEYVNIKSLKDALIKSDILVLTVPLNSESKSLIGKNSISYMKDDSIIVNVSRGGVIDEISLIEAMSNGKFLGVALDVFENEPLDKLNELWNFERAHITPHNSFISDQINERLYKVILNNLKIFREEN